MKAGRTFANGRTCLRDVPVSPARLAAVLTTAALAAATVLVAAGCSADGPDASPEGTWVGTITTEGNVTTVVNESGSLWGGPAALVEEASIGVASGEPWYMLGDINGVAASADRIYVADQSVPAVRAYTWEGEYVGDLGREGQGPGEYVYIAAIDVADDGRVFVHARSQRRVNVYASTGEFLDSHALPFTMTDSMVVALDGTTYGPVLAGAEDAYYRTAYGYQAHGPEGSFGDIMVAPRFEFEIPHLGGPRGLPVPHAPNYTWAMAPDGTMIAGVSDEYSFTLARPDGSEVIVRRAYEPIAIEEEERDSAIRVATDFMRRYQDSEAWDGPPVPGFKPAYLRFMPTRSGELWVIRPGPSEVYGYTPSGEPRWWDTYIIDAFGRDGRYLGEVELPAGARGAIGVYVTNHGGPFAWVRDDVVVMPIEDENGVIKVKRYRLTPPQDVTQ